MSGSWPTEEVVDEGRSRQPEQQVLSHRAVWEPAEFWEMKPGHRDQEEREVGGGQKGREEGTASWATLSV